MLDRKRWRNGRILLHALKIISWDRMVVKHVQAC